MVIHPRAEQQRRAELAAVQRELELERQRSATVRDQLAKCREALGQAEADLDDARKLLATYRARVPAGVASEAFSVEMELRKVGRLSEAKHVVSVELRPGFYWAVPVSEQASRELEVMRGAPVRARMLFDLEEPAT